MNVRVMYYSKTGNTKKVADAIAKSVNVNAEVIPLALPPEKLDLLFLGTGVYYGKMDKKMKSFIESLKREFVGRVAVFGTVGGQDKAIRELILTLRDKNISVANENYFCRGKTFGLFNRTHPDDADIKAAQEFAGKVIERIKPGK